jgi:hypothetical protein
VLDQPGEDHVLRADVAQLALVGVVDARQDTFEGGVLVFQRGAGLVEGVADVRGDLL